MPDLQRISPGTLLTLVVIGAAVYFLLPQFADIPGLIGQVKEANLAWVGPVILASLATYAGAALGLASSVAQRVSYPPALAVSLAGSFVNRLAPVKVAGAALNIRFLQRRGIDPLAAVAGAGLIAVAGMIGHLSITGVALLGAGSGGGLPFELPDVKWIFGGVALVLILIGVAIWVPQAAKLVREQVLPAIRKTQEGLRELARQPRKIIGLIVGGLLVPLSYSLCLYFSTQAFGADISLAAVAVVFLTLGTIASAAPTPGGVGAVEAALIAGLTGVGLASQTAVASVFLYRLATFWVPVLPGWGAFTWLRHADEV
jgi:undecaprenyl-diphosphatase